MVFYKWPDFFNPFGYSEIKMLEFLARTGKQIFEYTKSKK